MTPRFTQAERLKNLKPLTCCCEEVYSNEPKDHKKGCVYRHLFGGLPELKKAQKKGSK